jgi:hypothetical protein
MYYIVDPLLFPSVKTQLGLIRTESRFWELGTEEREGFIIPAVGHPISFYLVLVLSPPHCPNPGSLSDS